MCWAKHFRRSASRTPEVTSGMPAIVYKPNYYETRCSGSLLLMDIEVNSLSTEQSLKQPL
jgi:hypothetical protein